MTSSAPGCSASSGTTPNRFADAKSRRNYAGTSPITIASGKKRAVLARLRPQHRLADAVDQWAFCSLQPSPGARAYYDQRREPRRHPPPSPPRPRQPAGSASSTAASRHRTPYDEHTAWGHRQPLAA